jgi:hypothetical protein
MANVKRIPLIAVAALIACAATPATTLAAAGGFSVRPATFNPRKPSTRAYFQPTVAPGKAFHGKVVVGNEGRRPLKLSVYGTDGLTGTTSGAVYGDQATPLRMAGRWLKTAARTVTVAPHRHRLVDFTVRVPRTAPAGEHLAGIAFQQAATHKSSGSFSITTIFREVIGVEVRVPGHAASDGQLSSVSISPLPGTTLPAIVIPISNRGGLLCKPRVTATLRRQHGRAQVVTRQLDTVLPGDKISYPLPWPRALAPDRYDLTVRMTRCGTPVALHQSIDLADRTASHATPPMANRAALTTRQVVAWWPIALAAMIGPLAGALVAFVVLSTRRRRRGAPA